MKGPAILASITVALSSYLANANAASEHQQRELQLSAADIHVLAARTGAGSLEIQGVEGLNQILVKADIYSDDEAQIDFSLARQAGKAKLVADVKQAKGFFFGSYDSPYMDVTVQLPAAMALELDDGSGGIEIAGMSADIRVKDGSGALKIVGGNNLRIDDGSGAIVISQVTGDIEIEDGSGAIDISRVTGDIEIDDGSGNMDIRDIQGKVKIRDGSGNIEVSNTLGLTILEAGSGKVSFDQIKGAVSRP
ncbi:DUF4097 family beta strand repeat-containing protein [Shewanella sp. AS16]|uniref:DUF4097 family beta strand repeat-containing protein n=1 Tax=Shewanella sp. AS16 TaxID=2907625 RepID=UPI001F3F2A59|nr:DUF4097 family beta strand repeat-containing protein [Shewanella sp. AS16]MCE9687855.1 DUF4097 family beta strand repeat-containing protein [Shewanella sp. AS16]